MKALETKAGIIIDHLLWLVVGGALLFGSVILWEVAKDRFLVPRAIEWHGVSIQNPVVEVGQTLHLEYDATVNYQCPSEIRGFIRNAKTDEVFRRYITAGGYSKASNGRKPIKVGIEITDDNRGPFPAYTPGNYVYTASVIRFCPDGLQVDNNVPKVKFSIK